jgi:hypothetical protein
LCHRHDNHVVTRRCAVEPAAFQGGNGNMGNHKRKSNMTIGKVGVPLSLLPWLTVALMFVLRPG